jgi:hypothetical protein
MASARPKATHHTAADTTAAVDAFMLTLEHPFKREIESIRQLMRAADPAIAEGIKWNAPSFRTGEYFATVHLREKKGLAVILHLGAKVRNLPAGGVSIDDPMNLLKWLGKDRAIVVFESPQDFAARKAAFEDVVRRWIAHV